MIENLDSALRLIRHHEGGYVNHDQDPGGCTNMGITLATYRKLVDAKARCADLANIDWELAARIYRETYWSEINGDQLSPGIDVHVMDMAVNAGSATASKLLQRLLGVAADGRIGSLTLHALYQEKRLRSLILHYSAARLAYYRSLKHWPTFGHGWERRVYLTEAAALGLVAPA